MLLVSEILKVCSDSGPCHLLFLLPRLLLPWLVPLSPRETFSDHFVLNLASLLVLRSAPWVSPTPTPVSVSVCGGVSACLFEVLSVSPIKCKC